MKQILKVIFLTILVTIGAVALFIGGMYLFDGFNNPNVYAGDLNFNTSEVISSDAFSLQVNTQTENVNMTTLTLETLPGGEGIINYPRQVTIGQPFFISPIRDGNGKNVGGVVDLVARYNDSSADQSVYATCKILIDVPVEDVSVNFNQSEIKVTDNVLLASQGQDLSQVINVSPINSLMPYDSKSSFGVLGEGSIFASNSFVDKKIFLALINTQTGEPDGDLANFVTMQNGISSSSPIIQVEYDYNEQNNSFIIRNDIRILPNDNLGEVVLRVYVCPSYIGQENVNTNNVLTSNSVIYNDVGFVITDYTVDGIRMDLSDKEVYYDEEITLFLNNPNASNGDINLGIELYNNEGREIDEFLLRNNVYITIESDISDRLTRIDGSSANEGGLNVNYDNISANKASWGLKYYYNDFMAYYNYKNSSVDENKIRVRVDYIDSTDETNNHSISFYLIPRAREVESMSVKYPSNQSQLSYQSGEEFRLSLNDFNFIYANGSNSSFNSLAYYIPFVQANEIETIPDIMGSFRLVFSVTPSIGGAVSNFAQVGSWSNMANSIVRFTQGENIFEISFDSTGNIIASENTIEFNAGEIVNIEVLSLVKNTDVSYGSNIFTFSIGDELFEIGADEVKFYNISSGTSSNLPYLYINNVSFAVEFEFVTLNGLRYLYIVENDYTTYELVGIGSFIINAELVYIGQDQVYLLGVNCPINVYVYEEITSLSIYTYNESGSTVEFPFDISYEESQENPYYLYITSSQIETLRRLCNSGQLKISISQQFGQFDPDDYESLVGLSLREINQSTVTFGDFEEVYSEEDSSEIIGFRVPYYINDVYSIKINDVDIENSFDVRVYVDNYSGEYFYGQFIYEDLTTSEVLTLNVEDKLLSIAELRYSDTDLGTIDNPITLRATISNADIAWNITNQGGVVVSELEDLIYGFKYSEDDVDTSVALLQYEMTEVDDRLTLNGVNDFYEFVPQENGRGGLYFKNLPYYAGGILLRFRIYSDSTYENNMYYAWNGNSFVQRINDELSQGAELYFRVEGLNISITAQNQDIVGIKGTQVSMFAEQNGIFTISGVPGSVDYSKLFNCSINNSNLSLSSDYSTLTINGDFLSEQNVTIRFYYGTSAMANPLMVTTPGGVSVDSYTQYIDGAFDIQTITSFDAPSSNNSFAQITYKNGNIDAIENGLISISVSKLEDPDNVINISNNLVSFKSITGSYNASLRLTITNIETQDVSIIDRDITVLSKYTENDISVGTLDDESGDYFIHAGIRQNTSGGGIVLSNFLLENWANLNGVEISFSNVNEEDSLAASAHMMGTYTNSSKSIEIYSNDLNYDKNIVINFVFSFSDGGNFEVNKTICVTKNLELTLTNIDNLQSSDVINLGDVNRYYLTRDEVRVNLDPNDFSAENENRDYSADSFTYDSNIFNNITSQMSGLDSILILRVKYDPERDGETVSTQITFDYKTEQNYILTFVISINVFLIGSP